MYNFKNPQNQINNLIIITKMSRHYIIAMLQLGAHIKIRYEEYTIGTLIKNRIIQCFNQTLTFVPTNSR